MIKTKTNEALMMHYQQLLQFAQNTLTNAELELERAKLTLDHLSAFDPSNPDSLAEYVEELRAKYSDQLKTYKDGAVEVMEGVFDGYYMIGADHKKYPVPVNYSSKSKLIPGDVMKLTILENGKMLFKLIKPAKRRHVRATLSQTDDNKFTANTDDGKVYFLNPAAISFHSGVPGDELYIIINSEEEGRFAAIEAIINQ